MEPRLRRKHRIRAHNSNPDSIIRHNAKTRELDMRKKKKRLLLHVGTHKTGTSYIQQLLLANQEHLQKHSIGLARHAHPTLGHHHHLVKLIDEPEPDFDGFLEALRSENETTIFSSECMLSWLMNNERAARLCHAVTNEWDAKVVIYLRRQDYMKECVFAEVATDWQQGEIQEECHYCYDYSIFTERLAELFGTERILVGIYWDNSDQSLSQDFFKLTGLEDAGNSLKGVLPSRVSPNRTVVALLAKCKKENKDVIGQVRAILEDTGLGQRDAFRYQLSPEERRLFLSEFIDSNRLNTRLYRPDAEDYMTAISTSDEDWEPVPAIGIHDASQMISQLVQLLQKKELGS